MKLTDAAADQWEGNRNNERVFPRPSPQIVSSLVHSLDGEMRTLIRLRFSDGSSVLIGGGNDDRFVVTLEKDDHFFILCNMSMPATDRVEVICGGQAGRFASNQIVGRTELERQLPSLTDAACVLLPYSWVRTS